MMTIENVVAFEQDIAARLRSEESVEDIAAVCAKKIGGIAPAFFLEWCHLLTKGEPTSFDRTYRQRQADVNAILVKDPAFRDAFKRFHAWNRAKPPAP